MFTQQRLGQALPKVALGLQGQPHRPTSANGDIPSGQPEGRYIMPGDCAPWRLMAQAVASVGVMSATSGTQISWLGQELDAHDVVMLGAGFSKAVACHFPFIDELGNDALDKAKVPKGERPMESEGFEAWLWRIGEDQPYRTAAENLNARQLFLRVSDAIAKVMGGRQ